MMLLRLHHPVSSLVNSSEFRCICLQTSHCVFGCSTKGEFGARSLVTEELVEGDFVSVLESAKASARIHIYPVSRR
jgi:hypothetical protein